MKNWDLPLYLYFLDRELARLMSTALCPAEVERALKTLLVGTTSTLYCGISLLWESPGITADSIPFISNLLNHGVLDIVSHHGTAGEFLESRRVLYAHDANRYPMYFAKKANEGLGRLQPTHYKGDSTTRALNEEMLHWVLNEQTGASQRQVGAEAVGKARVTVKSALLARSTEAITLSLFELPSTDTGARELVAGIIQREISRLYVSHYVQFGSGDIPTGVPRLDYFELDLARDFPVYDVALISAILNLLGFGSLIEESWRTRERFWEELNEWRGAFAQAECRFALRQVLQALAESVTTGGELRNHYSVREAMTAVLRQSGVQYRPIDTPNFSDLYHRIASLTKQLRRDRKFDLTMETLAHDQGSRTVDVLLVTVADVERDAVLTAFRKETGHEAILSFGGYKTYYELGVVGGARVVMVQSEMGSVNPGAALSTVIFACDDLKPRAVIAVGIAFGVEGTEIGEVLVSKQMHAYEPQRVSTGKNGEATSIPRGAVADASARLLDRIRSASAGWDRSKTRFGLMLSGEKLIDDLQFRDELTNRFPEAIGGEMEGAGTYSAAVQKNTDWIVVKAVCDWADGNKGKRKKQRQAIAAENSALLVLRAIKLGGFV